LQAYRLRCVLNATIYTKLQRTAALLGPYSIVNLQIA